MKLPFKDIHNHLLPGVDDGFRRAEDSLSAIRAMADAGCREFVFTPHMNPDVYPEMNEQKLRQAYEAFQKQIPAEWGIKTSLAAEYMIVNNFEERSEDDSLLLHPDGSILVEMSYYFRSENLEETVFQLNMSGLKPILAHPERYTYMADCLKDFDKLVDMGCRFQLNLMSLSGTYGPASMKILKYLLDHHYYSFMASDLHTLQQLDRIFEVKPDRKIRKAVEKLMERMS